jgi:hypothetical protein
MKTISLLIICLSYLAMAQNASARLPSREIRRTLIPSLNKIHSRKEAFVLSPGSTIKVMKGIGYYISSIAVKNNPFGKDVVGPCNLTVEMKNIMGEKTSFLFLILKKDDASEEYRFVEEFCEGY